MQVVEVMKLQKNIFTFLVLFLSFQIGFGQERSQAELLEEFGSITWEDFVARLDNLMDKINQKPNSTAYIVIHNGKVSNKRERFRYEQYAKGHLKVRSHFIDEKRFFIIRAEDRDEFQIQLWIVPEDGEKPSFIEVKWDISLEPDAKSHIFTTTDWSVRGLAMPPEYLSLNLFSEYLEANPTARGHFVIRERSKEKFRKEKTNITNILVNKYKISPKRLRFFFVRENKPLLDYYPDVEVWLVPKR